MITCNDVRGREEIRVAFGSIILPFESGAKSAWHSGEFCWLSGTKSLLWDRFSSADIIWGFETFLSRYYCKFSYTMQAAATIIDWWKIHLNFSHNKMFSSRRESEKGIENRKLFQCKVQSEFHHLGKHWLHSSMHHRAGTSMAMEVRKLMALVFVSHFSFAPFHQL